MFVLATCLGCCVALFVILTISRSRGYRLPVLHHVCVLQPRVLPLLVGPCAVLGKAYSTPVHRAALSEHDVCVSDGCVNNT